MPKIRLINNKKGDKNQITNTKSPIININTSSIIPDIIKKVLNIAPIIRDIELKTRASKFFQTSKVSP